MVLNKLMIGNYSCQLVLRDMDLFGQKINLNLNGKDQYKTSSGGFISILIILIVIALFQSNIQTFFMKTNITTDQQIYFNENPAVIDLNQNDFMFALSIEQSNFLTNPYFNITIQTKNYITFENGTKVKTNIYVNLIPCTLDRFQNIFNKYDKNITDPYNELNLSDWLCPDYNYSLPIGGRFSSKIFEFIKVEVNPCSNDTQNNQLFTWKPICASQQQIDTFLLSSGQFRLRLYLTNSIVNPSGTKDVVQMFLDDELFFNFNPHKLSRQTDIYMKQYTLSTDNSLIPMISDQTEENIIIRDEYRDIVLLGQESDTLFISLYLRRSPYSQCATRSFQKIDGLLSFLGGFANIVVTMAGFFVAIYNKQQYLTELANKVFDFDLQIDVEKHIKNVKFNSQIAKKISLIRGKSYNQTDNFNFNIKSQLQNQQEIVIEQLGIKSRKEYLTIQIQRILQRGKPIFLSLRFLITQLYIFSKFKDRKCLLMEKAIFKINSDLDIYTIMDMFKQINLLKDLMMNKDQQILFNFSPKELISLKEQKIIPNRVDFSRLETQLLSSTIADTPSKQIFQIAETARIKTFKHVFKAYDNLFSDQKIEESQTNKILRDKLGKEINDIFQVSQFIDFGWIKAHLSQKIQSKLSTILTRTRYRLRMSRVSTPSNYSNHLFIIPDQQHIIMGENPLQSSQ